MQGGRYKEKQDTTCHHSTDSEDSVRTARSCKDDSSGVNKMPYKGSPVSLRVALINIQDFDWQTWAGRGIIGGGSSAQVAQRQQTAQLFQGLGQSSAVTQASFSLFCLLICFSLLQSVLDR